MKQLLALLFVAISAATFAQAPQGINYQAVIRDNGGAVLANQAVGMKVSILQGSPSGTAVYEESFSPTTSQFGLVNVVIGQGTVISGDFTTIDWSAGPYYAEVSADETGGTSYSVLGTQQLMSVPYSLYAETAENVTNDQVNDADADPNNEIQDISLTGTDLTISGGSTVDLSVIQDGVNDADADPNNEIQAISFSNDTLYLSNGGQVYLGAYGVDLVNDADADPNNEIQAISFSNDTLYLSNGGQVYLGAYGIDNVVDADADPTNELQSWSTLPGIPGDFADNIDNVDDADNDPNNEIQDISLTGTDLTISSGSTVDLSVVQDGVDDADNDPNNELQVLSTNGDTIFISNGNYIVIDGLSPSQPVTQNGPLPFPLPNYLQYTGTCSDGNFSSSGNVYSTGEYCNFTLNAGDTLFAGGLLLASDTAFIHGVIDLSGTDEASWYSVSLASATKVGGGGGGGGKASQCANNGYNGQSVGVSVNSYNSVYPNLIPPSVGAGGSGGTGGDNGSPQGGAGSSVDPIALQNCLQIRPSLGGGRGNGANGCSGSSLSGKCGSGGGGIYIICRVLVFDGLIDVSGGNGGFGWSGSGGGGGGGGCVVISADDILDQSGIIDTSGGLGGNATNDGGNGGNGAHVIVEY